VFTRRSRKHIWRLTGFAGISIGAVNAALIAGNPPTARVEKLREFWKLITAGGPWDGIARFAMAPSIVRNEFARGLLNQLSAGTALLGGTAGFFAPRVASAWLQPPGSIEATSYYDTAPLKATLERLVDFDRINAGETRFSIGAVNVTTGNFLYFDNTTHTIGAEHVMASGALPPGFPAVEIEGEFYWDGGLVSNTPFNGCSRAIRVATPSPFRLTFGAPEARCRAPCLR